MSHCLKNMSVAEWGEVEEIERVLCHLVFFFSLAIGNWNLYYIHGPYIETAARARIPSGGWGRGEGKVPLLGGNGGQKPDGFTKFFPRGRILAEHNYFAIFLQLQIYEFVRII